MAGRDVVSDTILAGLAVQAVTAAGVGLLVTVANDEALRNLSFWTMGSLGGATWRTLASASIPLGVALALSFRVANSLDPLLLGEETAALLGTQMSRVRRQVTVLVAILVGVSVAACGPIAFIGLLAPHLVRLLGGPRLGHLLGVIALSGAVLLVSADTVARNIAAPIELPVGVLTALIGGPAFVVLLTSRSRL